MNDKKSLLELVSEQKYIQGLLAHSPDAREVAAYILRTEAAVLQAAYYEGWSAEDLKEHADRLTERAEEIEG